MLLLGSLAAIFAAFAPSAFGLGETPTSTQPTPPAPSPSAPAPPPPAPVRPTRLTGLPSEVVHDPTAALTIRLSGPPAPGSPWPTLSPRVAGTWISAADTEVFRPASTLEPCATYQLTVWANTTAVGQAPLGKRRRITLRVQCPSILALQQSLARLGYLGARFYPSRGVKVKYGHQTRRLAARLLYDPPHGRLKSYPASAPPLQSGRLDATTRGGLTVFQEDHGIPPSETPEGRTWVSLLAALTLNHRNPQPYTWVTVSESIPETLELHRGTHVVVSSPTNTGVRGAETPQGVFPIYSRFVSTTMVGTNPDGTKYNDPGVPWVNYFNGGDAVHGFPRASYGSPQSNGCVELPISTAATVFRMLAIGDIVYITG
ncbi:MAG TPA: L,D-transpeptidase [Solirubrobacteraceae bacterium]